MSFHLSRASFLRLHVALLVSQYHAKYLSAAHGLPEHIALLDIADIIHIAEHLGDAQGHFISSVVVIVFEVVLGVAILILQILL